MVKVEDNLIVITFHCENPNEQLDKLREAITDAASVLAESDELYNFPEIPNAIATLIRFQGELFTS